MPPKSKTKPQPKAKTKKADAKNGVDKIIEQLIKNKDNIGSIVVSLHAKPGTKVIADDGEECDGLRYMSDVVFTTNDDGRASISAKTLMIQGLVADLNNTINKPRGLFG